MGKFQFRLQNILNIKVKFEEQKKIELGTATDALRKEEDALKTLQMEKEAARKAFIEIRGGRFRPKDIKSLNEGISYYDLAITDQAKLVKKAQAHVEKKRKELQEAMVQKKTYEKLKDIALENYRIELNHEEHSFLDEIVAFKYHDQK